MSDLVVGIRLTGDASDLQGATELSQREMARLAESADRVAREGAQAGTALARTGAQAQTAAARAGAMTTMFGRLGGVMRQNRVLAQQVGFQFSDIATQLSLGANAIQVFAIQGGQLLSFLPGFGTLIGAGVTVVGALAAGLIDMGDAADEAGDQADRGAKRIDKLREALEKLDGVLSETRGALRARAENIRDLIRNELALAEAELDRLLAQQERAASNPELGARGSTIARTLADDIEATRARVRDLQNEMAEALTMGDRIVDIARRQRRAEERAEQAVEEADDGDSAGGGTGRRARTALARDIEVLIAREGRLAAAARERRAAQDAAVTGALDGLRQQNEILALRIAGEGDLAALLEQRFALEARADRGLTSEELASLSTAVTRNRELTREMQAQDTMARQLGATIDGVLNEAIQGNIRSWEDLGRVSLNVLQQIIDATIQAAAIRAGNEGEGIGGFVLDALGIGASAAGAGGGSGPLIPVNPFGPTSVFRHGGVVGATPQVGTEADPAAWRGAPHYQSGGLVGRGVPIVAHEGEEVLTPDDPRHRRNAGGRGGPALVIEYLDARGADKEGLAQLERTIREVNGSIERRAVGAVVEARARNPRLFGSGRGGL